MGGRRGVTPAKGLHLVRFPEGTCPAVVSSTEPTAPELLAAASQQAHDSRRPILVHIVTNGVRGDSRVIKSARVSTDLGFETLVLGITREPQPEALDVDGMTALLVPIFPKKPIREFMAAWRKQGTTIMAMRVAKRGKNLLLRRPGPSARTKESSLPKWAAKRRNNLRFNVVFAEALAALKPTVIHVHDVAPLPAAIAYASASRLRGRPVRVIYDAHECIPEQIKSFPDSDYYRARVHLERNYIRDADFVMTVSPQIARLLKRTYKLPQLPAVVTNAPNADRATDAPNLRAAVGLSEDTPLVVYSGWIAEARGVDDAVRALVKLPEVHLAVVTNTQKQGAANVTKIARKLGVSDRVHFTDYVPPSQVTAYLASADVGLIPLKAGGHLDLSLPTKYREYIHAGLPLVVSNNKAMAKEVRTTGVGEVFRSGSVTGLAQRIATVLEDPGPYRAAITPDLLYTYSWEAQREVLGQCYLKLSPKAPRTSGPHTLASTLRELLPAHFAETTDATPLTKNTLAGLSLAIGRANSAGQAFYWAEAVSRNLGIPAASLGVEQPICARPHRITSADPNDLDASLADLVWLLNGRTHVMIDGFQRLFGNFLGDSIEPEIELLRRHGVRVALIAHGSDVRDPDAHMKRIPESYFAYATPEWRELIGQKAAANRAIAERFDGPIFVSTPGLLHDLPQATWLPITIDPTMWESLEPASFDRVPRVLHRPSRSNEPIKGSDVIVPVLQQLHDDGVIEYLPDPGPVPNAEMPALLAQADIVVEQIRNATYGAAALEALAAGRTVVGYVGPEVREFVGEDIPIVDATPTDFAEVITALAADPQRRRALVDQGRAFVDRWHSGAASSAVIAQFLES
ncbi:MAG TPA: hypothetical protein DCM67_03865 [Propionibacteriaceae bacterium]|nr:hypothetical protein [Propionibacteriaceae bacterium]